MVAQESSHQSRTPIGYQRARVSRERGKFQQEMRERVKERERETERERERGERKRAFGFQDGRRLVRGEVREKRAPRQTEKKRALGERLGQGECRKNEARTGHIVRCTCYCILHHPQYGCSRPFVLP